MKIRKQASADPKVELQMTPMIDIVFQLLVFFIMTFKVVVREGDFSIRMPSASASSSTVEDFELPVRVKLVAGLEGSISDIVIDDSESLRAAAATTSQMFDLLSERIAARKEQGGAGNVASELEVEFDTDYDLLYGEQIRAITAVSGKFAADGSMIRLADKIKFKDRPASN
ncbi:MAG TPA: biopolymer transporter ExbD [Planctomycetaceae bacterium]|nr:biopolymer transporter ExbD [Planctomycetaceae bacterium]HRE99238.1 biopolymer transporter ExbD [Pirellulaceae bacterium]